MSEGSVRESFVKPKQFNWMANTIRQTDEECVGVVWKEDDGQAMVDLSQDDMNDQTGNTGKHRKGASQAIG